MKLFEVIVIGNPTFLDKKITAHKGWLKTKQSNSVQEKLKTKN
jgi:hypothetical protein